jgi:hypothetical protein
VTDDSFSFTGSLKSLNKKLAQMPEVQAILDVKREEIYAKAQALFAEHHKTGEHEVTKSDGRVDKYVNIDGPGALSIEEGHFNGYKGKRKYVEGLHVLRRAIQ